MAHRRLLVWLIPAVTVAVALAAWEIFVVVRDISPLVLPRPTAIAENIVEHPGAYASDGLVTLREAFLGLVIAVAVALVLATAMVHSTVARLAVDPIQTAIRSAPVVALAPALVLWLGFGDAPKIIIAAVIAFPPLLVNAQTGFARVDVAALEVFRSLGASRREIFLKLRVPHSLPYLLSAMKICVTLALIGAVVSEWAGSSEGLGYRIVRAQSDLETPTVWGATAVLAALGIALTALVTVAERFLLRHHTHLDSQPQ